MSLRSFLRSRLRRSVRFPWIAPVTGRRFLTVRMDTTNRCNLRCSMCPMRLSDSDPGRTWHDMDQEVFDRIAREIFPVARSVTLSCGAEPLCNPSFGRHLEALYRSDVPVREMVTNGTLLGKEQAATLLAYPPTTVFVSVDGARERTHAAIRGGCSLGTVTANLRRLVELRGRRKYPRICFSTTIQEANLPELGDIVDLAAEVGASAVCGVPLVAYEGLDRCDAVPDMGSSEVRAAVERASARAASLGLEFSVAGRGLRSPGESCPYLEGWVFIDPDGLVDPCPYWNIAEPLGDLRTSGFDSVWHGGAYERLRRSILSGHPGGNCARCPELTGAEAGELHKLDIPGHPGGERG
jgi:MoaA/NifB/PqqE/SkfB family radical SAM enzyme